MNNKIYVGNLAYGVSEDALGALFGEHGTTASVKVITDPESGRSRGFAFVEMSTEEEAQKAIESLDGKEVEGRNLKVSLAKPKNDRGGGGGRGRGGFGGGRGGHGGGGRGGFGGDRGGRGGFGGDRGGNRY